MSSGKRSTSSTLTVTCGAITSNVYSALPHRDSYPTILYIRNGVVSEFDDDRTIENLRDFVCEHAGSC